jgi:hypothetical protein
VAGHHDYKLATRKLVSMFLQHGIEMFDFGLEAGSRKPKENDSGVDQSLVEDQLAEVPVGNEQNAFLVPGDRKDILIGKTLRVVARDGRDVMAKRTEVGNQPEIGALIEQELHT